MPKANLADIEIYYEVQGEGEPVLLRAGFLVAVGYVERYCCAVSLEAL